MATLAASLSIPKLIFFVSFCEHIAYLIFLWHLPRGNNRSMCCHPVNSNRCSIFLNRLNFGHIRLNCLGDPPVMEGRPEITWGKQKQGVPQRLFAKTRVYHITKQASSQWAEPESN